MMTPTTVANDRRAVLQVRLADDALAAIVACPANAIDEIKTRVHTVAALLIDDAGPNPDEFEKGIIGALGAIARDLATVKPT